jgi:MFS family permease
VSAAVRPAYARYVLGLLVVVYVLNFVDRQILSILLDPIKQDLGVSDTAMGVLTGFAFAFFYTFAGIPIARAADRGSRRAVIALGLGLWSAMTAASGLAQGFWQLAAARTLVGVGEAAGTPASQSLLADYFPPERRAAAFGFFANGIYLGTMLAFLLGGWLATRFDWRTAFLVVGVPGLPLALLVRASVRELPRGASEAPGGDESVVAAREVLRLLLSRRTFVYLVVAGSLLALPGYAMLTWGPAFLGRVHGMDRFAIGTALGVLIGTTGSAGAWLGGILADRLGRRDPAWNLRFPALATLGAVPFAVGFLHLPDAGPALAAFAVFYLCLNTYVGPTWSAVQGLVKLRMRATATALFLFVLNLVGLGLGPLLVGGLNDRLAPSLGDAAVRWSLTLVSLLGLPGALLLLRASRTLAADLAARDA